jgi:predicted PurR-regulated permease PerM
MLQPFVSALVLAAVFAILFKPLYRQVLKFTQSFKSLAAIITMLIVLLAVIIPGSVIGWQAFQEVRELYDSYLVEQFSSPDDVTVLVKRLENYVGASSLENIVDLDKLKSQVANWILAKITPFFGGAMRIGLSVVIFFLSLFFLLRDGSYFRERLKEISPTTPAETDLILTKLSLAVTSIVRGSLLVAIIQGILSSVGFFIFGVPQPILWGLTAAFAALIPGVGTALVLTPAIIFLFLTSSTAAAVGLLIWGIIAVGLIDNLLGPILVGRGVQIHPLLILLSVLGGLALFGPIGFLAGPLMLSLLFALLPIYRQKID